MSTWTKKAAQVVVYYGSADGLKAENKKAWKSEGRSECVIIADYNKDSWLDIAVTSYVKDRLRVFWGSPEGFDEKKHQQLVTSAGLSAESADLNADGFLDIVVGNYKDNANDAFNAGNFIFWGSQKGFRNWDKQWLPGYCTLHQAIADFDGDGFVTASELGTYVKPQVSAASDQRQTPQFGTLQGSGEVVFQLR